MSINPAIVKLAQTGSALQAIRDGLIRCGFELEFQALNGMTREQAGECDGDHDDDEGCPDPYEGEIRAPYIEVGDDSSVSGGEIRTVGALTAQEFMAAASALFDRHDFRIDEGCSFHIHLSVPGVKHNYGQLLQGEMQAYLLANQDRLPKSVRQRLKTKAIRFCSFKLDSDKMRAVHGHPQRTWEFRLFGNVQSKQDAWRCLLLAIDALRHAYQVRLKLKTGLIDPAIALDFTSLAEKALSMGVSLAKAKRHGIVFSTRQSA
jgi:hypothetical protein